MDRNEILNKVKREIEPQVLEGYFDQILINRVVDATLKAINYIPCCTELICGFDKINDGSLTKGKKYEKIHEHKGTVVIINDFDEVMSYNKEAFFEAN